MRAAVGPSETLTRLLGVLLGLSSASKTDLSGSSSSGKRTSIQEVQQGEPRCSRFGAP